MSSQFHEYILSVDGLEGMGSSKRGRLDGGSGDGESSDEEDGSMFNRSMKMICGG